MKYIATLLLLFPFISLASPMGDLINGYRTVPVVEYEPICPIAEYRLQQIQKDFSHQGFRDLTFLKEYGTWYENLAVEGTKIRGVDGVFNAWKKSPTHNYNLISEMKYVCIRHRGDYWVLLGWKPTI